MMNIMFGDQFFYTVFHSRGMVASRGGIDKAEGRFDCRRMQAPDRIGQVFEFRRNDDAENYLHVYG